MAPLEEDFDSNDLLFLEKSQTADPLILSFNPFIRSSTPQKKDDFLRLRWGSNPLPHPRSNSKT